MGMMRTTFYKILRIGVLMGVFFSSHAIASFQNSQSVSPVNFRHTDNADDPFDYSSDDKVRFLEISIAGGVNRPQANNTSLVISSTETDSVIINSQTTSGSAYRIGIGCHLFPNTLAKRKFLNDLLVEFNAYYNSESLQGEVWQYQYPQFNNYSFNAPITSKRFMLDLKPTLFTLARISVYPIAGIGLATNTIEFHEIVTGQGVAPDSYLWLGSQSQTMTVYDFGGGLRFNVTKNFGLTVEYIYTNLGTITPSTAHNTPVPLETPPSFKVTNSMLLAGITVNI